MYRCDQSFLGCALSLAIVRWAIAIFGVSAAASTVSGQVRSRSGVQQAVAKAPETQVVYLTAEELTKNQRYGYGGILVREICRQAFLIAARDGMGLTTRDQTLRETVLPRRAKEVVPFHIAVRIHAPKYVEMEISRGHTPGWEVLWSRQIPMPADLFPDYLELVRVCEELSRGEFIDVLTDAGYKSRLRSDGPKAKLKKSAKKQLRRMTFTQQFAALRGIHREIRQNRESRVCVGGLVRGYANLGHLTDFYCNLSHKAFKARALLYAERLVVMSKSSVSSLWHRAYARALVGFQAAAMTDISAAREREEKLKDDDGKAIKSSDRKPRWADLIDLYCHYETSKLTENSERDKKTAQLAKMLAFNSMNFSVGSALFMELGKDLLERDPECFRAYDLLCAYGGVSMLHTVTLSGPEVLMERVFRRVLVMSGLPEPVQRVINQQPDPGYPDEPFEFLSKHLPPLIDALVTAGRGVEDTGEPSFEALGRMIEEVAFAQVQRRANFMRHTWGVSVDDFLEASQPLYQNHTFGAFVKSYGLTLPSDKKKLQGLFHNLDISTVSWGLQTRMKRVFKSLWPLADAKTHPIRRCRDIVYQRWDMTSGDLETALAADSGKIAWVHMLLRVSPHSTSGNAGLIKLDWENQKKHADRIAQKYGHQTKVMAAFVLMYFRDEEYDEVKKWAKRLIQADPSVWAYRSLALAFKKQGDFEKWKATLDEFIETQEDYGLSHSSTRREIANDLMRRGKWNAALPYAEAAAKSWSALSLRCAETCQEGLGHWKEAEQWAKRETERYDNRRFHWLFWCKRTGHGDLEAARKAAEAQIKVLGSGRTLSDWLSMGVVHLLEGRTREASRAFERGFRETNDPSLGLHAALLAQELGRRKDAKAYLRRIIEKGAKLKKGSEELRVSTRLAPLLLAGWEKGSAADVDLEAVESLIETLPPDMATRARYFVGRFLEIGGDAKEGEAYLRKAATANTPKMYGHIIARTILRDRGVKLPDVKPVPAE